MTILIVGLIFVVLGTIAYVALRNAQDFSDANEIIPGVPTSAPKAWAGAHSPEARLHRRLRDAMTALRANRTLDEPALVEVRETLEREALALDDRLVAAAALPKNVRDEPIRQVGDAVEAIEAAVADIVLLRGPGADVQRGIEQVRTRLALVADARAELEEGSPSSLEQLRRQLEVDQARRAAEGTGPVPAPAGEAAGDPSPLPPPPPAPPPPGEDEPPEGGIERRG